MLYFVFWPCSVRAPSRSSSISPFSVCVFKGRGSTLHQFPVKLEANAMGTQPPEKAIQFQCGYCTFFRTRKGFRSVLSPSYVLLWTRRLISPSAALSFFFLVSGTCPPLTGLGYLLQSRTAWPHTGWQLTRLTKVASSTFSVYHTAGLHRFFFFFCANLILSCLAHCDPDRIHC